MQGIQGAAGSRGCGVSEAALTAITAAAPMSMSSGGKSVAEEPMVAEPVLKPKEEKKGLLTRLVGVFGGKKAQAVLPGKRDLPKVDISAKKLKKPTVVVAAPVEGATVVEKAVGEVTSTTIKHVDLGRQYWALYKEWRALPDLTSEETTNAVAIIKSVTNKDEKLSKLVQYYEMLNIWKYTHLKAIVHAIKGVYAEQNPDAVAKITVSTEAEAAAAKTQAHINYGTIQITPEVKQKLEKVLWDAASIDTLVQFVPEEERYPVTNNGDEDISTETPDGDAVALVTEGPAAKKAEVSQEVAVAAAV